MRSSSTSALRWDGFFPLGAHGLLRPGEIAEYLDGCERPSGWDLFAGITGNDSPSDFEAVGVTWLVQGSWPMGDWIPDLRARIAEGPPR